MRHRPTQEEMMEIGDLGDDIYQRDIEPHLTDADHGVPIAIDVDTGEWGVGPDALKLMETSSEDARIIGMEHIGGPMIPFGGHVLRGDNSDTSAASEHSG